MTACSPYLSAQLALIRPKVILALGATAAEALLQVWDRLGLPLKQKSLAAE